MKIFTDDNNINIVQSVASASTMISSLANEAKLYILSKFPDNFFKSVYIDTSETVTQQNKNDKYNYSANKIPYPSMTITPEISLDDPIAGTEKGLHLSSPNLYLRKDINRTYNKIIVDPDEEFGIYYTCDYITTNFNFKVTTNSFIQNADMAFFLKSRFQNGFFQYLNGKNLLTEIPKSFIRVIADLKGLKITDASQMDELRLYLIGSSASQDCVQKRVNLATGKQCFFMNEKSNLLTLFADLDCPSSVNRDAQVEGEYQITFRFQVSTYLPNAFILSLNKNTLKKLSQETVDATADSSDEQESGFYSVSVYATKNKSVLAKKNVIKFTDKNGNEQTGHLIYNETFMHELGKPIPRINLTQNMKKEFNDVYTYAIDKLNIDPSSLVNVKVYTRDGLLDSTLGKYTVYHNEDNSGFSISLSSDIDSDIVVAVFLNRLLFESIKIAKDKDVNYFNSNYLTSLSGSINGTVVKLAIKSFVSEDNQRTTDDAKAFRAYTPYGVGYISLLNEVTNTESPKYKKDYYKICVGFKTNTDGTQEPIIKRLEIQKN